MCEFHDWEILRFDKQNMKFCIVNIVFKLKYMWHLKSYFELYLRFISLHNVEKVLILKHNLF
jgi:hypothetical protein